MRHRAVGLVGLSVAILLAGCAARESSGPATTVAPETTVSARSTTSEPPPTTTTTTTPITTMSPSTTATNVDGPGPDGVEISLPPDDTDTIGPSVILVHGGSWITGSPQLLDGWGDALTSEGAVVFNASYTLATPRRGAYPDAVDDIACVVRYARQQAPEFTDSDELIIMGHSAGGHLAAVVSLAGDRFGGDCPYPPAPIPDRLVGLAAIFDLDTVAPLASVFMGATREEAPLEWAAANPIELVGLRPDIDTSVIVAENDRLLPQSMAEDFAGALAPPVEVEVIPDLGHLDLQDPHGIDVDLILGE